MIPLVAVSAAECIEALASAGFTVSTRTPAGVSLVKGMRVVLVPEVTMLAPEDLTRILRTAGLDYSDFLDLLSETPTEPAMRAYRPLLVSL